MIPECLSCRFWKPKPRGNEPFPDCDGVCRRNAPIGPVIKDVRHGWQIFPPMNSDQWCGEYEAISYGAITGRIHSVQDARPTAKTEVAA